MTHHKKTRFTRQDVEDHFIAVCEVNKDVAPGDPAPPLNVDPFRATERFIKEFAEPIQLPKALQFLCDLHRGMQPGRHRPAGEGDR